jgi:hypothetical protein
MAPQISYAEILPTIPSQVVFRSVTFGGELDYEGEV